MSRRAIATDWLVPVVALIAASIWMSVTRIDLVVSTHYYVPNVGWPAGAAQPWRGLYDYGVIPAWIIAVSALGVLVASYFKRSLVVRRRAAAFLVLVIVVGPGLIVNTTFKQNWGRPRPRDVQSLGGDRVFLPVWVKGSSADNGNAFASGHAAMAFYLAVPFFLLRRTRRAQALGWLGAGIGYGALMSVARIVQGAHFLSDCVWAAGFVWLSALACFYALGLHRNTH